MVVTLTRNHPTDKIQLFPMATVTVPILGKEQIVIGYDIRDRIVSDTLTHVPSATYVLVSDSNIAQHENFKALVDEFQQKLSSEQRLLTMMIAPGELSKTRDTKARVEDFMFKHSCTRDTVVLAVGGGVIGDMIGYVAATFMRGVRYVQIPTTLLAMVDSSIGGKTAVDVPAGKNLVGSFWQPELNFIELRFLETLPRREFINGMAEVIKTAAIWNADEFDRLERVNPIFMSELSKPRDSRGRVNLEPIKQILLDIVQGSVKVKAEVVTLDEREGGLRNILNFGHSIGHAYEALLTPHVLHGECVAIGSVLEAELSRFYGYLSPAAVARLSACFKAYELPVTVKDPVVRQRSRDVALPVPKLLEVMAVDKKNNGKAKRIVLLSRIGKTYEPKATAVPDDIIKVILSDDIAVGSPTDTQDSVVVVPPGSKSISNRVLVLCALATGTCKVRNLLHSDDTAVMLDALQSLGAAQVELADNGDTLVITGSGGENLKTPTSELYLGNAGTAARILTAVAALVPGKVRLTGNARMQERPIGALVDALRANGQEVSYINREGSLPVDVYTPEGELRGGRIELAATVSSQYVSALLIVAPYAKKESVTLSLVGGKPISQFYIDMTIQMMADFGVKVTKSTTEPHTYHIPQATYRAPHTYTVESDASSATYPLAFAALTGTKCTVPTIGSASLQGDARFAVDVLAPMGCEVEQTATSTTVVGPKAPLKGIDVDMEPMTDAFLTACVVAAVAQGTTRITGIANQHVKECDRINAMHDQLAKFGVKTVEGADGIDVEGVDRSKLTEPTSTLHSYDDHRVAMSLSLLSTQVSSLTSIDDRRCVEKTWPGWWDTLYTQLGVKLEGRSPSSQKPASKATASNSIVLVGMRGAGKTSLGEATATVLGLKFVDVDIVFEQKLQPVREFVNAHGWDAFREAEADVLTELLSQNQQGFVIACGGGIIELERSRQALKQFGKKGLVVHVHRDLADIKALLDADQTRPNLGATKDDVEAIYARREPLYAEVANRLFWAPRVINTKQLHDSLATYFSPVPSLDTSKRTFFLSLTLPDLSESDLDLASILEGCNAVELRVDLLKSWTKTFVSAQVGILRSRTTLPIIFTVRSQSQGGKFPDEDKAGYQQLCSLAFDLGVEFIDVELTQPEAHAEVRKRRGAAMNRTQVIASHHDPKHLWDWDDGMEWYSAFFDANRLGDIVKFVGMAHCTEDNFKLEKFRNYVQFSRTPFIGINMGVSGKMSRVFNQVLTPVTHPALPSAAAPGQLSVKECNEICTSLGMIVPKQFYIVGEPIGHSQSPNLHNSSFKVLGLPHKLDKLETSDAETVRQKVNELGAAFGGACVTIPLKEKVITLCSELREDAQIIGAVNTLIPTDNGQLIGGNTDWVGIRDSFKQAGVLTGENAVVLGAGGTALAAVYAFYRMGFSKVFVLNRTVEKIEPIVKRYASLIEVIPVTAENVSRVTNVNAILSCVPGDREIPAELTKLLTSVLTQNKGVLVEAAYKPSVTPVLKLAEGHHWETVQGKQMLVYQGVQQSEIWTGFRASITAQRAVV